jgi:indolepyruvate ferredoxin oxidoreductase alpha subunit
MAGIVISAPVEYRHSQQHEKLRQAEALFEESPFNTYTGPENPDLLLITSSACTLYSREAISLLGAGDRVGLLKLGTTWPLPRRLVERHLASTKEVLVVEEVISFLEDNVKILAAEAAARIGAKTFYGKRDGTLPSVGELNPDLVTSALAKILGLSPAKVPEAYARRAAEVGPSGAPGRELTFCPGCPHRASFWSIHNALQLDNRQGFVCGDIGCYTLGTLPAGFGTLKTVHAMGSGTGIASGFGKLGQFGFEQPVVSVCGDSTFFHAGMPALVNAVHHRSDITMVILDNSGTGMTGFQPHPGLPVDAAGHEVPAVDIAAVCRAIGARVEIRDPFDIDKTRQTLLDLIDDKGGVKVLVLRQICALSPEKKGRRLFSVTLDQRVCLGENCGCNRLCTRIFRCPGLIWNQEKKAAAIDEVICTGCGVCASICPSGAIRKGDAEEPIENVPSAPLRSP